MIDTENYPQFQIPGAFPGGNPSPQLINAHVHSEALPLTGFCIVLAPSSVEPKLPCIPSLLPLPLSQLPGRYLGSIGGGREVTKPPGTGTGRKLRSSIYLITPEMLSLFCDFPGETLWVVKQQGWGNQISDCLLRLPQQVKRERQG